MPSSRTRSVRLLAIATFVTATAVWAGAAAQAQATKSFLWKVQSSAGVLHLAGSVHALDQSVYPLSPAFQRAFDASGAIVEEIDMADANLLTSLPVFLAKGTYQDGRTFESVVSPETARLVAARFQDTPMMLGMLKGMKPWMVYMLLSAVHLQEAGLDPSLGLDKHFYDKAVAGGKTIIGLETAESQIDRMDRLPLTDQERMLRSTLRDTQADSGTLKALVAAWRRGDAGALEKLVLAEFEGYPAAYTSLIVERNRSWMPQMDACLARRSPCFVIVGAAHVVGPDGLLAMLQRKGYRVEQQ